MEDFYYHITDVKNAKSILENGLRANSDGDIFLFENKSIEIPTFKVDGEKITQENRIHNVADMIASGQVLLKKYVMFEVSSKGFNVPLVNDNVAEIGHKFQWILHQKVIEPKYINVFGIFKTEL